ncbi:hypothetical protein F959_01636, partial [Acinetobacter venetianus RAG-1 = CIP 110063]
MKINIRFDWAFITSVFTILLFWCGYWYNYGYAYYYNYQLNAFDFPISLMLMEGLLRGFDVFVNVIILMIIFSFLSKITLRQLFYLGNIIIALIAVTFRPLFVLLKFLIINVSEFFYDEMDFQKVHKFTNPPKQGINFIIRVFKWVYAGSYAFLQKNQMTLQHIEIDTSLKFEKDSNRFEISALLHYLGMILFLVFFLAVFKTAEKLANSGEAQAKVDFEVSTGKLKQKKDEKPKADEYPEIKIKGDKSETTYFLTPLCVKGICAVTDCHGSIKTYDIKDITIHNPKLNKEKEKEKEKEK